MNGPHLSLGLDPTKASRDDTDATVRVLHSELTRRLGPTTTAEHDATARRRAAVELAAALSAHFRIGIQSEHVTTQFAAEIARRFETVPLMVPAVAGSALANIFGDAVGESGRRDRGAVYTPNDVVAWMVAEALDARVAAALEVPRERARALLAGRGAMTEAEAAALAEVMLGLRVLDPAAGAGAFLVGAARAIAAAAQRMSAVGVPGIRKLCTPLAALEHCCHGFEIDRESAEVATIAILLSTVGHRTATFSRDAVVSVRNPLVAGLQHPVAPDGWDLVVMNPPYVGEKHIRARLGEDLARSLRAAHGFARDLLVHFALGGLDALRPGGAMSAIVSDTSFTMDTATELRRRVVDEHRVHSIAWCRPFSGVAVRGGILTVVKAAPFSESDSIECIAADNAGGLREAPRNRVDRSVLSTLPSRPFFRPTKAAIAFIERWSSVAGLDEMWHAVAARRSGGQADTYTACLEPGEWTLLGSVVRSGQGLATGDDRRFVGYVLGSPEADAAAARAARIAGAIHATMEYRNASDALSALLACGMCAQDALLDLITRDEPMSVPGRKPFRVIEADEVRTAPLTDREQSDGIAEGPRWVPFETSDRSSPTGGARWLRANATVLDWSIEAVSLLNERRQSGDRRPVLRNQDLWFRGGVTHNRVTSYLRARRLPAGAIFSSESPVYVPIVEWLDEESLLALLNSSLIEFAVKTFLASRNHIEVGHMRRLPVPVLTVDQKAALSDFTREACGAVRDSDSALLRDVERALDEYVRALYGVSGSLTLEVVR